MTGEKLVLTGQLIGVFNNGNDAFFARFNMENHEIDVPCDRKAFHGIRFGEAVMTFEVTGNKPSIIVLEQTV